MVHDAYRVVQGFVFARWQLCPCGSFSKIRRVSKDSLKDGQLLELFGSTRRLFFASRFDAGMEVCVCVWLCVCVCVCVCMCVLTCICY